MDYESNVFFSIFMLKLHSLASMMLRRIKILPLLLLSALTIQVSAQKQANFWYFGEYAGLSFALGVPIPLTDGQLTTGEGCSSISTAGGQLLFYTDGITVWNKNHQVMPNGTGLQGHSSSTQSGIIVPKPSSLTEYYIFTVDAVDNNLVDGLKYSKVDMSLDGGKGDIVVSEKNITLIAPSCEKVTAVGHSNGSSTWVITHEWGTNRFFAFQVTIAGVDTDPVISAVGDVITGNMEFAKGYIKVSPDGTKLAVADNTMYAIEIFDFNNTTGVVSDQIKDTRFTNPGGTSSFYGGPYGVEFSPSSQYLYISEWKQNRQIFQYDLEAGDDQAILDSRVIVGSVGQSADPIGALQIGPDNRLYVARQNFGYLSRINSPNTGGIGCNFENQAIFLSGRQSTYGLPPFIQSFFSFNTEYYWDTPTCFGLPTHFYTSTSENPDSVLWNFGDPDSGPENTSDLLNPSHVFTREGMFVVQLTVWINGQSSDAFHFVVIHETPEVSLGNDTLVCATDPYVLDAGPGHDQYLWQTGDTTQTLVADTSGTYWCMVSNEWGCTDMDTIEVTVYPAYNIPVTAAICDGESYWAGGEWQTETGMYYDSLLSVLGCDSIIITDLAVNPVFNTLNEVSICEGDSLFAGGGWQTESGTYIDAYQTVMGCDSIITTILDVGDMISVNVNETICQGESIFLEGAWQTDPGVYHDTVSTSVGCDSVYITNLSVADTFEVTNTISICEGDSVWCGGGWQTQAGLYTDNLSSIWGCDSVIHTDLSVGAAAQAFQQLIICQGDSVLLGGAYRTDPGTYNDTTMAASGCDSIMTTILLVNPVYTIERDTSICEGESIYVGNGYQTEEGSYTDFLTSSLGCDSILVTHLAVKPLPWVYLGNDTVLQNGTEMVLYAYYPGASVLWQDGSGGNEFLVTEQGNYSATVTTECGSFTDSIFVEYGNFYCDPYIPNAFTPNGDGRNDHFRPVIDCEILTYKFTVMNRWGAIIFSSTDPSVGWDGRLSDGPADAGTYAWYLTFKSGLYNRVEEKKTGGTVLLIR
jgi:gliding motility-associated-like protein